MFSLKMFHKIGKEGRWKRRTIREKWSSGQRQGSLVIKRQKFGRQNTRESMTVQVEMEGSEEFVRMKKFPTTKREGIKGDLKI